MTLEQYIAARKQIERILQYLDNSMQLEGLTMQELYDRSVAGAIVSSARYELNLAMYDSLPIE